MRERIAGFCELLLLTLVRALLPTRGRHRTAPDQLHSAIPPLAVSPGRPLDVWPFEHDTHLVRPYLLTPEELRERKRIHGAEVPA